MMTAHMQKPNQQYYSDMNRKDVRSTYECAPFQDYPRKWLPTNETSYESIKTWFQHTETTESQSERKKLAKRTYKFSTWA